MVIMGIAYDIPWLFTYEQLQFLAKVKKESLS